MGTAARIVHMHIVVLGRKVSTVRNQVKALHNHPCLNISHTAGMCRRGTNGEPQHTRHTQDPGDWR